MRLLSRVTLCLVVEKAAMLALMMTAIPGRASSNACSDNKNYPVIVYDANERSTIIVPSGNVNAVVNGGPPFHYIYNPLFGAPIPAGAPDPNAFGKASLAQFLCDGKPAEVYIFNRRLLSTYTASLTSVFNVPASTIDLRGATPQAAPAATATTPAVGSKGFSPIVTSTNLLTTDVTIANFLNDETYEKPLTKLADDVATVRAQAEQFDMNVGQYTDLLGRISGSPGNAAETPLGASSLEELSSAWNILEAEIEPFPQTVSEAKFSIWTNRADRLQSEVVRLNSKLATYPVLDTLINLQASAAILKDNYRGVLSERDAIHSALTILQHLKNQGQEYLTERQRAELRVALRAHYGSNGTISEPTLARIVDAFKAEIPKAVSQLQCPALPAPPAPPTPRPNNIVGQYCAASDYIDGNAELGNHIDDLFGNAREALAELRKDVADTNEAEADTLRAINVVYDIYRAPVLHLNLDLQGNHGNLFVYYTLSRLESFNRYQISNDIAQPISNCALAISANVNSGGGFNTCVTASTSALPSPSATYSTSQFPPLTMPPPAASGGATTPAATTSSAEYFGNFQMHHFSHGTLITGIAYDSVPNQSFSWVTCSTSASNTAGNFPSGPNGAPCISPTATTANPTPATYYQLVKSKQIPIAAVEGVDLFLFDSGGSQDMFPGKNRPIPGLFIGSSAYPLNHYFVGTTVEPERGFNISAGVVFGSENILPSSFGYQAGSYASVHPSIPTSTKFKTGVFFMIGFDTSLFGQIFNGSIFKSVLSVGTAGSPPASSSTPTQ